jgi:heme exporter protein B
LVSSHPILSLNYMSLEGFQNIVVHEFSLEFRQKFSFAAQLLYVAAVVFIIYLSFFEPDTLVWNSLFWIILVFSGVQAGATSFVREFGDSSIFYYQYCDPLLIYFAKIFSVWLKLLILGFVSWFIMSVILGDPVLNKSLFSLTLVLGCLGFASLFSFLSALAMGTGNSGLLLAVLSFPVLLPVLLSVINLSISAMIPNPTDPSGHLMTLVSVILIVFTLGIFLFPFLWRS